LPNFTSVSSYSTYNELHDAVRSIYSPIALFPAIWPETWCYTLSEALEFGLPVIAPNLGALGTRLGRCQAGLAKLYDPALSSRDLAVFICDGFNALK
jgi:glycosyltransferase involved in cell wall biosynthesis